VAAGAFSPPPPLEDTSYAALEAEVQKAIAFLENVTPDQINDAAEKDVLFSMGETKIPFTGAGFLTSFSTPNFHFHATTLYALLRKEGVGLGKRDYLSQLDIKQ
jgi:hypothetical protein